MDSVFVNDVDCVNANDCVAVGTFASHQTDQQSALVMRNTGRGWVRDPSVTTADVVLMDVDCTSSTHCLALGQDAIVPPSGIVASRVYRWNGARWAVIASPPRQPGVTGGYAHISCGSAVSCMAVGGAWSLSQGGALAARWNGSRWTVVPMVQALARTLAAVSCLPVGGCWMAGTYQYGGNVRTVTVRWTAGTTSTTVAAPSPAGLSEALAIGCASPTACYLSGRNLSPYSVYSGFALRLSGGRWVPWLSRSSSVYRALSCSQGVCYGAGGLIRGAFVAREVVGRFTGTTVATELPPSHARPGSPAELTGISCATAQDCSATGLQESGSFVLQRTG